MYTMRSAAPALRSRFGRNQRVMWPLVLGQRYRAGATSSRVPARGWCSLEHCQRAVAQLGSALDWGSRGREFKSRQPDHIWPSESRFPIWEMSPIVDTVAIGVAITT